MHATKAIGRARGKAILFGEHAVVYGIPAIAVGLDRGATAEAVLEGAASTLELWVDGAGKHPTGGRRAAAGDGSELGRALAEVLRACGAEASVRIQARTDLPAAAGLGCSAALGVALVRALDALAGRDQEPAAAVAERALAWERVFHGNPSGVDTAVAAHGGCLLYQKVEAGPLLKPIKLAAPLLLAVGHSGTASSTKAMVEEVARLRERSREMVERSFDAIRILVQNARLALEAGDARAVGQLMDLNQMLLGGLLLSTEPIETMCRLAREAGALGAKLTGAGGGGCVIALCASDAEPVLASWKRAGFRGFATSVEPDDAHRAGVRGATEGGA